VASVTVGIELVGRDAASGPIGAVQKALSGLSGAASAPVAAVGKLTTALGAIGLAANGMQAVAGAAQGLGQSLGVGLAVQTENTRAKFAAFIKDAGQLDATLALVRSEADKTPFTFQQMSAAVANLIPTANQAKVPLLELTKTAEILAASHPEQGLEGAAFALREAVSGDFQSIIDRFDLPRTTLNNLKAQGVPAAQAVQQAMAEMGYSMDLVGNLAHTTEGRFSTFQDAVDGLRLVVAQPILAALGEELDRMSGFLAENDGAIRAFAQTVGDTLATAVRLGADAVGSLIEFLQPLGPALTDIGQAAAAMVHGDWEGAMRSMEDAAVRVLDFIDSQFGDLGGVVADLGRAAMAAARGDFSSAMDLLGSAAHGAADALTDALGGAVDDLGGNFDAFRPVVEGLGRNLGDLAAAAAGAVSGGIDLLRAGIEGMLERAGGADQILADVAKALNDLGQAANGASPLVHGVGEALGGLKDAAGPLTSQFGALLVQLNLTSAATEALQGPAKNASAVIDAFWAVLNNTPIGKVVTALQGLYAEISRAQSVAAEAATGVDRAWQMIITATGALVAAVGAKLNEIGAALRALPGRLQGDAVAVGASLVQGIAAGMNPAVVVQKAAGVVIAAIQAARAAADAHSPSREFEAIGADMAEGAAVGLDNGADDVAQAAADVAAGAVEAASTAVEGTVSAFDQLSTALGAQFERTFSIVEEAQNKIENDRDQSIRRMHRDEEVETRKHERTMADLQERLAEVMAQPFKTNAARKEAIDAANEKIEKAQEDHGRRMEDIALANADRLDEIDIDAAERMRDAQEKQALNAGKALQEYQRGLEQLGEDTARRSQEIAQRAADARADAERDAGERILQAQRDTAQRILDAEENLAQRRQDRAIRAGFASGQEGEALTFRTGREDADLASRQAEQLVALADRRQESAAELQRRRTREDADNEYELYRDLEDAKTDEQKAQIQERYNRQQQDLARRRRLDDEDRDYAAQEDQRRLEESFRKQEDDLRKRRAADEAERVFRKQQQQALQDFNDKLDDDALKRTIGRLEDERDQRIQTIKDALDEKLRKIQETEQKEQDALRKSYDQKAADLKERFVDKVGQMTADALEASAKFAEEMANRAIAAMAKVGSGKPTTSGLTNAPSAGQSTWENQTQAVRDMFTATYGADAKQRWQEEHAAELGVPVGTTTSSGGGGGGGGSAPAQTADVHAAGFDWGAYNAQHQGEARNPDGTVKRAGGGPVYAGWPYWVGESGPEPFVPKTDGYVLPHGALGMGGPGGAAGGAATAGPAWSQADCERLAAAIGRSLGAQTVVMDGQAVARIVRDQLLKHGARNGRVGLG
jgi:hypothetical protein